MQLNDNFYHYTLHQHRQDPSPYPWPTPKQFRATVAWPRDKPIFQEEAGPVGAQGVAQGDGGRAEDDEDMTNLVNYFIGGDEAPQP